MPFRTRRSATASSSRARNGDGTDTWHWREDDPTASYLTTATVGLFIFTEDSINETTDRRRDPRGTARSTPPTSRAACDRVRARPDRGDDRTSSAASTGRIRSTRPARSSTRRRRRLRARGADQAALRDPATRLSAAPCSTRSRTSGWATASRRRCGGHLVQRGLGGLVGVVLGGRGERQPDDARAALRHLLRRRGRRTGRSRRRSSTTTRLCSSSLPHLRPAGDDAPGLPRDRRPHEVPRPRGACRPTSATATSRPRSSSTSRRRPAASPAPSSTASTSTSSSGSTARRSRRSRRTTSSSAGRPARPSCPCRARG